MFGAIALGISISGSSHPIVKAAEKAAAGTALILGAAHRSYVVEKIHSLGDRSGCIPDLDHI